MWMMVFFVFMSVLLALVLGFWRLNSDCLVISGRLGCAFCTLLRLRSGDMAFLVATCIFECSWLLFLG